MEPSDQFHNPTKFTPQKEPWIRTGQEGAHHNQPGYRGKENALAGINLQSSTKHSEYRNNSELIILMRIRIFTTFLLV
jgi:hypothetical protein